MKLSKFALQTFLLITISVFMTSCSSEDYGDVPDCIEDQINTFKKDVCDENATVILYEFQGADAYVFDIGSCIIDGSSNVVSDKCEILGILGTEAGFYHINGVSFIDNATLIRTVWEN